MRHIVIALSLLVAGCGFVHDERIDGPYRLIAIDEPDKTIICLDLSHGDCIGRTPPRTIGYGFDDRYITALVEDQQTGATHYYFIDRADDGNFNASDSTQGPFTDAEFSREASRLNLPTITRRL